MIKTITILAISLILALPADAAQFDQVEHLDNGFSSHRVSYSIKMSKNITLGLQDITGTAKLYIGDNPSNMSQVAEIGFDYALGLGVSVGQEVGVTQQLYYDRVPPKWYVLIETSGNADFEMVSQLEQPYTP